MLPPLVMEHLLGLSDETLKRLLQMSSSLRGECSGAQGSRCYCRSSQSGLSIALTIW